MLEYHEWQHVFKLDPNKTIDDDALEAVCESGTDAVIVGGTDGVTEDNTLDLLMRIRRYSVACALEVSSLDAVTPGFDYYLIPSVVNTDNVEWVNGRHHAAIRDFGPVMNWDEVLSEAYCVLNPEAKVARLTEAKTDLTEDDIVAYARMTENLIRMPVFYLEYSGTYGDPAVVEAAAGVLKHTRLFYGGGITNPEQAAEMAAHADTIVVGNAIYDNLKKALKTVKAVKEK
ncbi:geranylgeranylglyceryl/heptaprenylglyceryl phosphate synthase [Alteribacter lacisalsi]|uniref:Heptaprenylglyceryl phosphate synthase n=1 Tax=Alteribacter lacisalsi TaxID=2045244 RepID=A0A2W0HGL8_9BACI|nr:heptaprenylglyceryl phosphate synthase [Alteribacter lacisalsi]PYZ96565.1 geranylgeranylglyceryl/heptaprenylglyceryl phosphate synthase [Alteribacter lacisalsi]